MKKLWICLGLAAALSNSLGAQPEIPTTPHATTVAEFNTLLRDLDLNADTQNGYSITKAEYTMLRSAWNNLPLSDRNYLLDSDDDWKDFASMLVFDFMLDSPWNDHVKKAVKSGAGGLSLTASRYKSRITLQRARKTLVDLCHQGPSMVIDGQVVITDQIKLQAKERSGGKALKRLERWEKLINSHQNHSDWDKLKAVNDFFKRQIKETPDWRAAEGYDYWQSPIETLVRGKGDCDDFVMAQYVSLRLLEIPAQQLRVGLVAHPTLGGHGVVLFYPTDERDPWVLDNLTSDGLGAQFGRIQRLSLRMKFDEIKPLWGVNENILTEFRESLTETATLNDPREELPAFATALVNSQRLLPREENLNLAQATAP